MRQFKFRVWNTYTNAWHCQPLDNAMVEYSWKDTILISKFKNNEELVFQEFTGLQDKEGREIYEGDIIKDKEGRIETIHFEDGIFWAHAPLYEENTTCEIIGNIFENPKLLE